MAIIISPPFGNYLSFKNCISTIGTYTLEKRAGLIKRLWRIIKTVRYNRRQQSWINKLGLPNPGVDSLFMKETLGKIISIHGFNRQEWNDLIKHNEIKYRYNTIEFNLSCPNVGHKVNVDEVKEALLLRLHYNDKIICKLPPIRWMDYVDPLYNLGIRYFHCCNTILTHGGGISGKPLMQYSLWAIEQIRKKYDDDNVILIGGGGVTSIEDVRTYLNAGANHVAVGSMLFNPFNWKKIKNFVKVANQSIDC